MPDGPCGPAAQGPDLTLVGEITRICFTEGGYPDRWPKHLSCPCCGGCPLVYAFSKYGIAHDRCRACDFICVNPFPPEPVVRKLYAAAYYSNHREFTETELIRSGESEKLLYAPELMEKMLQKAPQTPSGEWLDVGGGIGVLADLVRRRKPGWSVTLNEFNPRSVELARELFGLEAIGDTPDAIRASGANFDAISCAWVLEHIPEPLCFIRDYAGLLRPGGRMAIFIPQFTALNAAVSQRTSSNVVPPFHTSLFREDNFGVFLERTGMFEQIEIVQAGPAAFSLLHHYPYNDYWDVTIPTREQPVPQGVRLADYPIEMAVGLNALAEAETKLADHFALTDGRQYMAAYARRAL